MKIVFCSIIENRFLTENSFLKICFENRLVFLDVLRCFLRSILRNNWICGKCFRKFCIVYKCIISDKKKWVHYNFIENKWIKLFFIFEFLNRILFLKIIEKCFQEFLLKIDFWESFLKSLTNGLFVFTSSLARLNWAGALMLTLDLA